MVSVFIREFSIASLSLLREYLTHSFHSMFAFRILPVLCTKAIHQEATEQTRLIGSIEGETDQAQIETHSDIHTAERIKEDKLQLIAAALSGLLVLILFKGLF
jgi:hypothetical protein